MLKVKSKKKKRFDQLTLQPPQITERKNVSLVGSTTLVNIQPLVMDPTSRVVPNQIHLSVKISLDDNLPELFSFEIDPRQMDRANDFFNRQLQKLMKHGKKIHIEFLAFTEGKDKTIKMIHGSVPLSKHRGHFIKDKTPEAVTTTYNLKEIPGRDRKMLLPPLITFFTGHEDQIPSKMVFKGLTAKVQTDLVIPEVQKQKRDERKEIIQDLDNTVITLGAQISGLLLRPDDVTDDVVAYLKDTLKDLKNTADHLSSVIQKDDPYRQPMDAIEKRIEASFDALKQLTKKEEPVDSTYSPSSSSGFDWTTREEEREPIIQPTYESEEEIVEERPPSPPVHMGDAYFDYMTKFL